MRVSWREVSLSKLTRRTHGKVIQDSLKFWIQRYGLQIPGNGFWIFCQWNLNSGFQSLVGFRIPWAEFRIPKTRIPIFSIPKAQISHIPRHKQKFPGYRSPNSPFMGRLNPVTHVLISFTVSSQFRLKITPVCLLWMVSKWHLWVGQWKEELANLQDIF